MRPRQYRRLPACMCACTRRYSRCCAAAAAATAAMLGRCSHCIAQQRSICVGPTAAAQLCSCVGVMPLPRPRRGKEAAWGWRLGHLWAVHCFVAEPSWRIGRGPDGWLEQGRCTRRPLFLCGLLSSLLPASMLQTEEPAGGCVGCVLHACVVLLLAACCWLPGGGNMGSLSVAR